MPNALNIHPKSILISSCVWPTEESSIVSNSEQNNHFGRVYIKHRRSEQSPATTWYFPAKLKWPVKKPSKLIFIL